jgi:two-component system sensor histidine kinase/response regulator
MTIKEWLIDTMNHPFKDDLNTQMELFVQLLLADAFYLCKLDHKTLKIHVEHGYTNLSKEYLTSSWVLSEDDFEALNLLKDMDYRLIKKQEKQGFINPNLFTSRSDIAYFVPMQEKDFLTGFALIMMHQETLTNTEIEWLIVAVKWLLNVSIVKTMLGESNQVKQNFLANISHELRTPLSGIKNALNLLESTSLSLEQKKYTQLGQKSVASMMDSVNLLIDFNNVASKSIQKSKEVFILEDLMVLLIHQEKNKVGLKPLQMHLDFDHRIQHKLIGDHPKLTHMLSQLLDNAIKYTTKGEIKLSVTMLEIDESSMKIRFSVSDTGIGMSPFDINRILEPLHQIDQKASKTYRGLGLGLSIVSEYAHILETELKIVSKENQGSIFSFELPFLLVEQEAFEPLYKDSILLIGEDCDQMIPLLEALKINYDTMKNPQNQNYHIMILTDNIDPTEFHKIKLLYGKDDSIVFASTQELDDKLSVDHYFDLPISKKSFVNMLNKELSQTKKTLETYHPFLNGHVMIVDDNRLNRLALESILSKIGLRSTMIESGLKAIEAIQKGHFDLILMDIQMPQMDGIETTRKIRNLGLEYEKIPIVAVTANAYFKDYDLLKSARINDVLFKPIQWDQLNLIMRKHIIMQKEVSIPQDLMVFDEIDFNVRFEGAMDIALEVLSTFKMEQKKDLERIGLAIEQNDLSEIIEASHYFKGSCSYLSAKRAVWLLDKMMDDAKQGNKERMNSFFDLLQLEIRDLVLTISNKYQ